MDNYTIGLAAFFIGLCVGILIMAVIADRNNKRETEKLQGEIAANSRYYLQAVSSMNGQIEAKDSELQLKQRVLDSLNEEIHRLRRIIESKKQKGGRLCG